MPNWVFNTLQNYTEEMHKKYKGDGRELDFNKLIPMPEELKNTIAGSTATTAKHIAQYREYMEQMQDKDDKELLNRTIKYDRDNPIQKDVRNLADNAINRVGELCIENPDKSLNALLKDEKHNSVKYIHDKYVKVFGNQSYSNCTEFVKAYENYIAMKDEEFQQEKESEWSREATKDFSSIEEYGRHVIYLGQKYGFEDWYSFSNANWGSKWNACRSEYDPEEETLRFDTAWSIPYPVIAKIAEENPEVKLYGYAEEETGWFEEYETDKDKVKITKRGEYVWGDGENETEEKVVTLDPPEEFTYQEVKEETIKLFSKLLKED